VANDLVLCPRCEHNQFTPYDARGVSREEIVRHPFPALSRVVNVYICSSCGRDEAMRDFTGEPPVPPGDWPVKE
jgi:hypothetical protein